MANADSYDTGSGVVRQVKPGAVCGRCGYHVVHEGLDELCNVCDQREYGRGVPWLPVAEWVVQRRTAERQGRLFEVD